MSAPAVLRFVGALLLVCLPVVAARSEEKPRIPQPPLRTVPLVIGKATVQAEVADDPVERNIGLMARTSLADGEGMLFVFPQPQPLNFWMRDTVLPLSIAYINGAGVIREIHDMEPLRESPVRSMFRDLQYALEVPQGWFAKHGILPGDRIVGLPAPSTALPD